MSGRDRDEPSNDMSDVEIEVAASSPAEDENGEIDGAEAGVQEMEELLLQAVDDLAHLSESVNQIILSFSACQPLEFIERPTLDLDPPDLPVDMPQEAPNMGAFRLKQDAAINATFLAHEIHIYNAFLSLRNLADVDAPIFQEMYIKVVDRVQNEMH